jgi:putative transposase
MALFWGLFSAFYGSSVQLGLGAGTLGAGVQIMGRRRRDLAEPCCYHITHRCQERRFLFKFEIDRQNYLHRLRETVRRWPVDVLNYIVTSNHIHLLLWSSHARHVSEAMHFLQGTVAGDYNRRKQHEGSVWRGRYHPTLVETGRHLSRCLFYIDMNMVRAGVCQHPVEWKASGYHELSGLRRRNLIINRDRLFDCLDIEAGRFQTWYMQTVNAEAALKSWSPEPYWAHAVAVGSRASTTPASAP